MSQPRKTKKTACLFNLPCDSDESTSLLTDVLKILPKAHCSRSLYSRLYVCIFLTPLLALCVRSPPFLLRGLTRRKRLKVSIWTSLCQNWPVAPCRRVRMPIVWAGFVCHVRCRSSLRMARLDRVRTAASQRYDNPGTPLGTKVKS